ncbi:DNA excision repair protein ERCC-6-like [Spea bombifrons]|uniref:DNA excision repair protein ERCC-6-like n=1 Tax=Spea bombifrons TaxID=233779 RepID=UPI002349AE7C|nr:DNA excision repair protein ERCC-6-like [Spea bombifrons]
MEERVSRGSSDCSVPGSTRVDPEQADNYERYVKKAKHEAKNGNLSKSIEYFRIADNIYPSEKLKGRIEKLEEALKQLDLQEEQDDEFVDVLNSGLMVYKELYAKLFEHQKEGVAFLYSLYRDGRKGGILADDMGLGKTIQVIAFLSGMFDAELIKCVLLIMPTTLISNWVREFEKWTPGMRVNEFHGTSKKERTRDLEKIQRKGGIIITTYQMLINNWQQISTYNGREFVWDYIILDEAHKIKTSSTKTAKACYAIPAKNRILLTGTPIQNNLREMWSLYDFACQGTLLGTLKTFKMEYENPITRAREKDSTPGEKALGLKISENLMKIIQPYFIRRTKSDVQKKKVPENQTSTETSTRGLTMPSLSRKNDLIIWVYLSSIQEDVYRKFISLDQIKELLMTTRSPLAELTILKKLCDHPRLLSARACVQLGLEGDDYQYNEGDHETVTKFDHLSDEALIEESGKLSFLIELLQQLREEGHRTLVFSQSRKMLDIIDRILCNRGFKIMRIDGTVPIVEREKVINKFQSNRSYSVLLLTTQVGGVGLTLTAADRVVIFDPSWNPATDAQAVDRAYRIGQQENVVIYRLITCGTVEEKIYRRQIFKDSLIRQTTGDKKNPFRYFTKHELKELFLLEDTRTSSTQIQLQNMHAAQRKTDTHLDLHIAYLHTLDIFGISDHDLIYAHEVCSQDDDDQYEDECEGHYIQQRVQKAHELMQMESQMNKQLMEQIQNGTEGAWLRQTEAPEKVKEKRNTNPKEYNSHPVTVDLTVDDIGNISCQMTSIVIGDSSGDEDESLQPAPFAMTVPSLKNGNTTGTSSSPTTSLAERNSPFTNYQNILSPEEVRDADMIPTKKDVGFELLGEPHGAEGNAYSVTVVSESISTLNTAHKTSSDPRRHSEGIDSTVEVNTTLGMKKEHCETSLSMQKSQLPCDFNLLLEDSMEKDVSNCSMRETESVMETSVAPEMEPMLVLEDSIENTTEEVKLLHTSKEFKSETNEISISNLKTEVDCFQVSVDKSSDEIDDLAVNENAKIDIGNVDIQFNVNLDSEDEEEMHFTVKNKAKRRVLSDSESDGSVFVVDEIDKINSPFNSPSIKGISASTPKLEKSLSDSLFAQRRSYGGRRSIASRRSIVHVAVEEATDVQETIDDGTTEDSEEGEDEFIAGEAKETENEEYVELEEEPVGETLPLEESIVTSQEDYESDSFVVKSSSEQEEDGSTNESTGEVELGSGEQMDSLAQETDCGQVVSLNESYTSLVKRGKQFKDDGCVKEALDCFLKALDIKSGDPEVMMMTLSLYRQLS